MALPAEAGYAKHVYHVYAVRVKNRDKVFSSLSEKGINCNIHYPVPIHLQKAYSSLGLGVGRFPVAELCASEFLSLPMFPELSREQIESVATELKHESSKLKVGSSKLKVERQRRKKPKAQRGKLKESSE